MGKQEKGELVKLQFHSIQILWQESNKNNTGWNLEKSIYYLKYINTFLSFSLGTQLLYFTVSLLINIGLSTGFSSGIGSHLLLDRLGLFLNFGNKESWANDIELLHEMLTNNVI